MTSLSWLDDPHAHLELTAKGGGIETHIDLFVAHSVTEVFHVARSMIWLSEAPSIPESFA